jgi:hypothetical protein
VNSSESSSFRKERIKNVLDGKKKRAREKALLSLSLLISGVRQELNLNLPVKIKIFF